MKTSKSLQRCIAYIVLFTIFSILSNARFVDIDVFTVVRPMVLILFVLFTGIALRDAYQLFKYGMFADVCTKCKGKIYTHCIDCDRDPNNCICEVSK